MVETPISKKAPLLWHYTSMDGFEGIYRSRTFWATHYSDMNDASEQTRFRLKAIECFSPLVRGKFVERMEHDKLFAARVVEEGGLDSIVRREAEMHIGNLHLSIFGQFSGPFLVSFCTHLAGTHEAENGLLSMWRGYGAGGGIAIVLSTSGIENLMKEEADVFAHALNHLGDVKYDNDRAGIESSFSAFFELAPRIVDEFYSQVQPAYEEIFTAFVRGTTLVKHHAFHEEQELRIVICPRTENTQSVFYLAEHKNKLTKRIRYRKTSAGEARYFDIFGKHPLPIEKIIIGPSRVHRLNKQRVEDALGDAKIPVIMSDIPFLG